MKMLFCVIKSTKMWNTNLKEVNHLIYMKMNYLEICWSNNFNWFQFCLPVSQQGFVGCMNFFEKIFHLISFHFLIYFQCPLLPLVRDFVCKRALFCKQMISCVNRFSRRIWQKWNSCRYIWSRKQSHESPNWICRLWA